MVIGDQLTEYVAYQRYLEGKNEAWRRESKGLEFQFEKGPIPKVEQGEDLITRGGRVLQMSHHASYGAKTSIMAPVWTDEFLYQALDRMPYDVAFILSGPMDWHDLHAENTVLRALCVVESGQTAHLSQYLQGTGLRGLDIVVKSGATLRHDVYLTSGEFDYLNVYVESFGVYEQVYAVAQSHRRAVRVLLMGDSAKVSLRGCIAVRSTKAIKEHVRIEQYAPNTESVHQVKTLSHGRVDVTSEVYIHNSARGSQSEQGLHHILLSDKAKAFSKPALEIAIDEVSSEHGATMSMVDEALLFYMLSRGLPLDVAKQLYIDGVIERMYEDYPEIKENMAACLAPSVQDE